MERGRLPCVFTREVDCASSEPGSTSAVSSDCTCWLLESDVSAFSLAMKAGTPSGWKP